MTAAVIAARKPEDVAHEVEALVSHGCEAFLLRSIDHGGTLDLERLGAARYAAGVQVSVVLDDEEAPVASRAR